MEELVAGRKTGELFDDEVCFESLNKVSSLCGFRTWNICTVQCHDSSEHAIERNRAPSGFMAIYLLSEIVGLASAPQDTHQITIGFCQNPDGRPTVG